MLQLAPRARLTQTRRDAAGGFTRGNTHAVAQLRPTISESTRGNHTMCRLCFTCSAPHATKPATKLVRITKSIRSTRTLIRTHTVTGARIKKRLSHPVSERIGSDVEDFSGSSLLEVKPSKASSLWTRDDEPVTGPVVGTDSDGSLNLTLYRRHLCQICPSQARVVAYSPNDQGSSDRACCRPRKTVTKTTRVIKTIWKSKTLHSTITIIKTKMVGHLLRAQWLDLSV